jgi:calcium-dependent protein kinase
MPGNCLQEAGHAKSQQWIIKATPDIRTEYDFGKVLGKGQFGTTRLAISKHSGDKFACKSISKRKLINKDDIEDVKREVQIMYHLAGHPNVVKLIGVYEDRQHIHLVMELCSGGELFDRIIQRGHYTEKDASELIRTIVTVVAHCHAMGVIHRDLKPENFLLSDSTEHAVLKATDFGLSVFFKEGQLLRDIVGSAYYVAPEVLARKCVPRVPHLPAAHA